MLGGLAIATPAFADAGRDDLAAYVRARAADADGAKAAAAAGYAAALSDLPGDPAIAARAYRAALIVGNWPLAAKARDVLQKAGVAPGDAVLIGLTDALIAGDRVAANNATDAIAEGPFGFLAAPIRAWMLAERDPAAALTLLNGAGAGGNALAKRFAAENRALIEIAAGRSKNAKLSIDLVAGLDGSADGLRIDAAQFLAGIGEGGQARAMLTGGGASLVAYRDALGNGVKPTTRVGVARLFLRLAAVLDSARAAPAAVLLARAADRLEPGNDRVTLALAHGLVLSEAPDQAIAALDMIAATSPAAAEAQVLRIDALHEAGREDAALAAAAAVNTNPGASVEDAQRYGDLLVSADRYDDAAKAYATAIARAGEGADWTLYLQYGGALDQAGRWKEAEPELEKAVELAPKSPIALNYLGYARLEHGGSPVEASRLLERATALQPDSAAIVDSLAWSYFLQGDTARALPMLERAAADEPANSTISEHLGDAYWAAGRRYEARYAWRAAAVTADDGARTRLDGKIADGPSVKTAAR